MVSSVLVRHTRDRLNSLCQMVEPSHIEAFPRTAQDYEDLLNLVLEFPESYRRAVDMEFRRLFKERSRGVAELQEVRNELANMADRYTTIVQSMGRTPVGQQPLFHTRLKDAVATLQRDKARVLADWPVCDEAELAQAAIEQEQGHFVPVIDAFALMRGISVEEMQRRLEAHKVKRKESPRE